MLPPGPEPPSPGRQNREGGQCGQTETESDRTRTVSLATLMKGFYQVLSVLGLEPDIKTHCMSFIAYGI